MSAKQGYSFAMDPRTYYTDAEICEVHAQCAADDRARADRFAADDVVRATRVERKARRTARRDLANFCIARSRCAPDEGTAISRLAEALMQYEHAYDHNDVRAANDARRDVHAAALVMAETIAEARARMAQAIETLRDVAALAAVVVVERTQMRISDIAAALAAHLHDLVHTAVLPARVSTALSAPRLVPGAGI